MQKKTTTFSAIIFEKIQLLVFVWFLLVLNCVTHILPNIYFASRSCKNSRI